MTAPDSHCLCMCHRGLNIKHAVACCNSAGVPGLVPNTLARGPQQAPINPQETFSKSIAGPQQAGGLDVSRIEAPTGFPARAWTEREKHDCREAMQRIVEREAQQAGGEVQRFEPNLTRRGIGPWSKGDYVLYTDYAALQAEVARLREARDAGADLDCAERRDDADFWWTVAAFRGIEMARQIHRAEAAEISLAEARSLLKRAQSCVRHSAGNTAQRLGMEYAEADYALLAEIDAAVGGTGDA